MQREEKQNCINALERAESQVDELKSYWVKHKKELGDMMEHIDSCRAMTMTYNNLGVYHKQNFK